VPEAIQHRAAGIVEPKASAIASMSEYCLGPKICGFRSHPRMVSMFRLIPTALSAEEIISGVHLDWSSACLHNFASLRSLSYSAAPQSRSATSRITSRSALFPPNDSLSDTQIIRINRLDGGASVRTRVKHETLMIRRDRGPAAAEESTEDRGLDLLAGQARHSRPLVGMPFRRDDQTLDAVRRGADLNRGEIARSPETRWRHPGHLGSRRRV
jgi:hypothetical protein